MPGLPPDIADRLTWVADGVAFIPPAAGHAGAASMLIDDGETMLVDAGLAPAQRRKLADHVDVCFLTHTHVAHAHGARDFREVWAPRREAAALQSTDGFCEVADIAQRDVDRVKAWLPKAGFEPTAVTKTFLPGGLLKFGRSEWRLIDASGHSPGLTLLLDPVRHILFAADMDGAPNGPWYGWPSCEVDELEQAALELAKVDVAILLTSHAAPRKRGIRQLFRDVAAHIKERDRRILDALRKPHSVDELVARGALTGKVANGGLTAYHERVMTEKHLYRLLSKDFVAARQDGRYELLD